LGLIVDLQAEEDVRSGGVDLDDLLRGLDISKG
jgi:hypothetical protein